MPLSVHIKELAAITALLVLVHSDLLFYSISVLIFHVICDSGGKLHQKAQIEIQTKKRKSHAKKITGFQVVQNFLCFLQQLHYFGLHRPHKFLSKYSNTIIFNRLQFVPGTPSEVLITSADSQIRLFDGIQLTQKFRGTP